MSKFNDYVEKHYSKIILFLLLFLIFKTCTSTNNTLVRRLDKINQKIDSLSYISATKKDLQIEGLKTEKRMIQSTDRKILDVNRQSEIDKEIEVLSK